jgi:iron complex outermembrane receptor protein
MHSLGWVGGMIVLFAAGIGAAEDVLQLEPQMIEGISSSDKGVIRSHTTLDRTELDAIRGSTLVDTLAHIPGVSQTYYGPGVSRPVIRGLNGNRILVLQDGLELMDISAQSADHAVATDLLLVDRVEVLRGAPALIYGSHVIGGVINVMDNIISNGNVLEYAPVGRMRTGYTSVNDGKHAGIALAGGGGDVLVRGYGIYKRNGDYHTPRYRVAEGNAHEEERAHVEGHDLEDEEGGDVEYDRVLNTYSRVRQAGAGVSWILNSGYIGGALTYFDTHYGVPNEELSSIRMERKRIDVKGSLVPDGPSWLKELRFSAAYCDYQHKEFDRDGSVGSMLMRHGMDSRIEMMHTISDTEGVAGAQVQYDRLKVRGSETMFSGQESGRVIHQYDEFTLAFFVVESYSINEQWTWVGGMRSDSSWNTYEGNVSKDRSMAYSASTGLQYKMGSGWQLEGNIAYSQRAADLFERYSDGFHHANGVYEVGNPRLGQEKSLGMELSLIRDVGAVTGRLTGYYNHFNRYIYLSRSGEYVEISHSHQGGFHHDDVARYDYRGVKAMFLGVEGELVWRVYEADGYTLDWKIFGDYVYARNLTDREYLPRTPPWRVGGGVDAGIHDLRIGVNWVYVGRQDHTAPGESKTDGYLLLNLHASYLFHLRGSECALFVRGNNLTNVLARVHTSFLKDRAPLPGIGFEVGFSAEF